MLQQTQVDNVVPYFRRFLKRFPSLQSLARAKEESVLSLWTGLGYYSRARNLRKAAGIIRKDLGGRFPRTYKDLLSLPGVGPYTAGAVLSIAFDLPAPIFDGNVRRVLSRFHGSHDEKALKEIAQKLVLDASQKGIRPSVFNQAIMELGALICLPQNPNCRACPLSAACSVKRTGLQSSFPRSAKRQTAVQKFYALAILKSAGQKKFLVVRRPGSQRWLKDLWEFPMVEIAPPLTGFAALSARFRKETGVSANIHRALGEIRHNITRHQLKISVFSGTLGGFTGRDPDSARLATLSQIGRLSASSMLRKSLALYP